MMEHRKNHTTMYDLTASEISPGIQQHVLQLAMGYQISQALYVVVRLGIPDHLSDGPHPVEHLARVTESNETALYRIMRALSGVGIFREHESKSFALTPSGRALCSGGRSLRNIVLWTVDPFHYGVYSELLETAKTGIPACTGICGESVFEHFTHNPELGGTFDAAMTNVCEITVPALVDAYDFSCVGTLVDVAGGHGTLLFEALKRHPSLRGILCDSARCLPPAEQRIRDLGLEGRCSFEAMDLLEQVPEGGDAYILKNVLHDWADDQCIRILRNCRKAMDDVKAKGKRVLIAEAILTGGQSSMAKWLDLDMLVLAGGRERTEEEFRGLIEGAGLEFSRIVPTRSLFSIIEAVAP